MSLLSVQSLTTSLPNGVAIVDGISFHIAAGETFALLGESGCGKSMTALSLMRLLPDGVVNTSGAVHLAGQELLSLSERDMRAVRGGKMAMIFQEPGLSLNPVMTVGAQIAEVLERELVASSLSRVARTENQAAEDAPRRAVSHSLPATSQQLKTIALLTQVGIPDPARRIHEYPHQLSGGMKQRVMIAMALAGQPDLLIADEPTTALDVTIQAQVLQLLRDTQAQSGMAMLLITHDLGVVAQNAHQVAVMYAGEIVEQASRTQLFAQPQHPYTQKLFAALPDATRRNAPLEAIPGAVPALGSITQGCRFAPRCEQAWALCHEQTPAWSTMQDGRGVRCHLYVGEPVASSLSRVAHQPVASSLSLVAKAQPVEGALHCSPPDKGELEGVAVLTVSVSVPNAKPETPPSLSNPPMPPLTGGSESGEELPPAPRLGSQVVPPISPSVSYPLPATRHKLLQVTDLQVHFPIRQGILQRTVGQVKAVDGISLDIAAGRTLALVGESGCGKTTAGKALLQLLKPTAGSVQFLGQELVGLTPRSLREKRAGMQMVFQDPYASLNPKMRVAEILQEGMDALHIGDNSMDRQGRIDGLLDQVGLSQAAKWRYPHEFSGGQRQRIAIARALAVSPQLLICDEPTSALDVSVQAQILNLLKSLQQELGLSYLFITHNLAVVDYLAHEVCVMYLGRIVERGTVDEVLRAPHHPYTQALLSAVPRMDAQGIEVLRLQGEMPSPANPPQGCHFHPRCPHAEDACRNSYPPATQHSATHVVHCHFSHPR